jgi:hypothetical protein
MPANEPNYLLVSATGALELPVARDRDLKVILQDFGMLELLETGELVCVHCQSQLSWTNLGALVVHEGKVVLFCDLSDCIEQASELTK